MVERKIIINVDMTHQKVAEITGVASIFGSDVVVEAKGTAVDAKSILGLFSLGLYKGNEINVVAVGTDEVDAVESLANVLEV